MAYVILATVFALIFTAASFAADIYPSGSGNTQGVTDKTSTPVTNLNINGTVISVDQTDGRVRVKDYLGAVTELKTDKSTVVTKGFKPAKFSDVRAGDTVLISFDANSTAQQINVSETK